MHFGDQGLNLDCITYVTALNLRGLKIDHGLSKYLFRDTCESSLNGQQPGAQVLGSHKTSSVMQSWVVAGEYFNKALSS